MLQWLPVVLIALSACAMSVLERYEAATIGLVVAVFFAIRTWRSCRPRLIRPSTKKPIVIDQLRGPRG